MKINKKLPIGIQINCSYNDLIKNSQDIKKLIINHYLVSVKDIKMSPDKFIKLAKCFGELITAPKSETYHLKNYPEIRVISNKRKYGFVPTVDLIHCDQSYNQKFVDFTFFYSLKSPLKGGKTKFWDQVAAYNDLPINIKRLVTGAVAIHGHSSKSNNYPTQEQFKIESSNGVAYHPMAMTHWYNGRISLYDPIGHCQGLLGLTDLQNKELVDFLKSHCSDKKYAYEHTYENNELVIWDNIPLMHAACGTPANYERLLWQLRVRLERLFKNKIKN